MGRMVRFSAGEGDAPGYLATPEGDGPFPGVVVIQEYWGLVGHIKSVVVVPSRGRDGRWFTGYDTGGAGIAQVPQRK